ncbi:alpha/beta fold hydrolase [Dolichospermum lemmermannii CS-548]|uniref:alpha/beta hydrolase n=1 Tax=Dolichospermum lemmermannii TaxID=54295 RepID=UPI002330B41E|nr:alpha/beta fold hydrolase [Dolichospermum lemmermannii]MDB9436856.1 alpha/beta fold hydrolase [Dolichospermum lemmermannii CS-548]
MSLFFYPDQCDYGGSPETSGFDFENLEISVKDEITLNAWLVRSKNDKPKATIIYFHGNAANMTNHWSFVDWIPENGFDLLCFDYRGYGKSTGKPSFEGVLEDCCKIIDFARTDPKVRNKKFIIFGQSLGGAFSILATAKKLDQDILGMVLDSTFNSFQEIASLKVPSFLKVLPKFLITKKYNPEEEIYKLKMPKLFIHSRKDPVVPYKLGEKLYKSAPEKRTFITVKPAEGLMGLTPMHMPLFSTQRDSNEYQEVISFLDGLIENRDHQDVKETPDDKKL